MDRNRKGSVRLTRVFAAWKEMIVSVRFLQAKIEDLLRSVSTMRVCIVFQHWYFEVRDLERSNRVAFKIWARQQANLCQIIISVWRDHVLNISHKKNIAYALAVSSKVKVDASLRRHTLFTVFLRLCLMHAVVAVPREEAGGPASPRPGAPPQLRGARLAPWNPPRSSRAVAGGDSGRRAGGHRRPSIGAGF